MPIGDPAASVYSTPTSMNVPPFATARPVTTACGPRPVTWLVSSVTAPSRQMTRPVTLAPVVSVSLARAMIVPAKFVPVPRVAELPTWKKTLASTAPLMSTIEAPGRGRQRAPDLEDELRVGGVLAVQDQLPGQSGRCREVVDPRRERAAAQVLAGQVGGHGHSRERVVGGRGIGVGLHRQGVIDADRPARHHAWRVAGDGRAGAHAQVAEDVRRPGVGHLRAGEDREARRRAPVAQAGLGPRTPRTPREPRGRDRLA